MADFFDQKIIDSLNVAISRATEDDAKKQYVQDVLKGHGDMIKKVLLE